MEDLQASARGTSNADGGRRLRKDGADAFRCEFIRQVDCALIQHWVTTDSNHYDLAIVGDVLEHLKPKGDPCIYWTVHQEVQAYHRRMPALRYLPRRCLRQPARDPSNVCNGNFFDRYNIKEKHIIKTERMDHDEFAHRVGMRIAADLETVFMVRVSSDHADFAAFGPRQALRESS